MDGALALLKIFRRVDECGSASKC